VGVLEGRLEKEGMTVKKFVLVNLVVMFVCVLVEALPSLAAQDNPKLRIAKPEFFPPAKKAVSLTVTGKTIAVTSFPAEVMAPPGANVYDWKYPDSLVVNKTGNTLVVISAPSGKHEISVKIFRAETKGFGGTLEEAKVTLHVLIPKE
jgi:hypothetical protein